METASEATGLTEDQLFDLALLGELDGRWMRGRPQLSVPSIERYALRREATGTPLVFRMARDRRPLPEPEAPEEDEPAGTTQQGISRAAPKTRIWRWVDGKLRQVER